MKVSSRLLSPGFVRRSLDEFKRLSDIAINLEGIRTPTKPFQLLDFSLPSSIPSCLCRSDAAIGGFSKASFEHVPPSLSEPSHARFHGNISVELPRNRPQIQQTGYAMWRNQDRAFTLFGKSLWDVDPYTYLAMRVKSDGRKYFVNVQTESIVHTDIHQHRLYAKRPGEWETVLIKWREFVRTNYGQAVEPQTEMLTQKIRTIGIGLTDRIPGPFDLAINQLWATNGVHEEDQSEDESEPPDTKQST